MQLVTRLRSTAMRVLASGALLDVRRTRARIHRKLRRQDPAVHYFHQADDPYSHLAVQKLDALRRNYDIPFVVHLVGPPTPDYQGDAARFPQWALRDASSIAGFYDVSFESYGRLPDKAVVEAANEVLALQVDSPEFPDLAFKVGADLWRNEMPGTELVRGDYKEAIREGNQLRRKLGHYFGGMFYFDGEWFWGLDRLHHLETRLHSEGHAKTKTVCVPEPAGESIDGINAASVTLEYFPSLRSPYTAIGHERVMALVANSGVNLVLRPVIPMMMRGVPAPRAKQLYIMMDAAREARAAGIPFGKFVDPFGEPVRKAFALYPAALRQDRGARFVGEYLSAAFAEGIDITTESGLILVMERAGMNAQSALDESLEDDWESLLASNLDAMMQAGLWGVPSFKVSDTTGSEPFACWGQDRIWRVQTEIVRRSKQTFETKE